MAFYDIFEQLCAEKGITPTQAGRDNGIAQGVVSMWKKRGSTPNAQTLVKLADYFNTTPAYLMGNSMAKHPDTVRILEKLKDSKPFNKISDAESFRAGFLQFNSEKDRIVYFYQKLTDEGKIAAGAYFFQNLDKTTLSKVADQVMNLSENPLYQRTEDVPQPPTEDNSEG